MAYQKHPMVNGNFEAVSNKRADVSFYESKCVQRPEAYAAGPAEAPTFGLVAAAATIPLRAEPV